MPCNNHKCVWLPLWRGCTWSCALFKLVTCEFVAKFWYKWLLTRSFSTFFLFTFCHGDQIQRDGDPSTSNCSFATRCRRWPSRDAVLSYVQRRCTQPPSSYTSQQGRVRAQMPTDHAPVSSPFILNSFSEMVTMPGSLRQGSAMHTSVAQTFPLARTHATNTSALFSFDQAGIIPNWPHSVSGAFTLQKPGGTPFGPLIPTSMAKPHSPRWPMLTCCFASSPSLLSPSKTMPDLAGKFQSLHRWLMQKDSNPWASQSPCAKTGWTPKIHDTTPNHQPGSPS